jgi:hypothetical protein
MISNFVIIVKTFIQWNLLLEGVSLMMKLFDNSDVASNQVIKGLEAKKINHIGIFRQR